MYLRGALNSAHFSPHEKNNYLVWMHLGTLQILRKTLSYIKAKVIKATKTKTSVKHT
jgi:hypothetical protein